VTARRRLRRSRRVRRLAKVAKAKAKVNAKAKAVKAKVATVVPVPRARAETLLLDFARELGASTEVPDLAATIERVAAAYAEGMPLVRALHEDLLREDEDKTARLALAWAREQVRLAFLDLLQRARTAGRLRADVDVETLAWLWLAACEALAHEPPGAVPDRVHALAIFLRGGER
jgi:hypothetical protein